MGSEDKPLEMKVEQDNLGLKNKDWMMSSANSMKDIETKIHSEFFKKKYNGLSKKFPGKIPVAHVPEITCIICGRLFDKTIQMQMHLVRHTKIFKELNFEGKIKR